MRLINKGRLFFSPGVLRSSAAFVLVRVMFPEWNVEWPRSCYEFDIVAKETRRLSEPPPVTEDPRPSVSPTKIYRKQYTFASQGNNGSRPARGASRSRVTSCQA